MAYLDPQRMFDTAAATPLPPSAALPRTAASFEDTEWRVILLAEKEPLTSLAAPGRFARFLARLAGTSADHRLANPRLEALRRFSVLAWHYSYALPMSAIAALRDAGFSEAQLDHALASIAGFRDRAAPRHAV